jgi:hypothetical protein
MYNTASQMHSPQTHLAAESDQPIEAFEFNSGSLPVSEIAVCFNPILASKQQWSGFVSQGFTRLSLAQLSCF